MDIVINDTNIFLDLYEVGLLDTFFQLPIQVHTVDFVINEITFTEQHGLIQRFIDERLITVKGYAAEEIPDLYQFKVECGGNLTLTDSTVIYYARSLGECRILTGDRQLRNRAEERGIKVSGILYLFDLFVENGLLNCSDACQKLKELLKANPRLPKREIEIRIAKWISSI